MKNDLLQGKVGESVSFTIECGIYILIDFAFIQKLESNQVDALDKLVELFSPSGFDAIESSVEKITNLLEGNKREFITGVSFCDLKELLVKLVDSKYFETVVTPKESINSSVERTEDVKSPVEETVSPSETIEQESQPQVRRVYFCNRLN